MLNPRVQHQGATLIEVMITIVVLAFGLLGLASLQSKLNLGLIESYQRAQAVLLLGSLSERMNANQSQAASYVSTESYGTGDAQPTDCSAIATIAERDECEWSNDLKGAAELKASAKAGAMKDARGCVTELQAPNASTGICSPGIYQISVAWQGMLKTQAPVDTCGQNLYGDDAYRRVISTRVSVALLDCR